LVAEIEPSISSTMRRQMQIEKSHELWQNDL